MITIRFEGDGQSALVDETEPEAILLEVYGGRPESLAQWEKLFRSLILDDRPTEHPCEVGLAEQGSGAAAHRSADVAFVRRLLAAAIPPAQLAHRCSEGVRKDDGHLHYQSHSSGGARPPPLPAPPEGAAKGAAGATPHPSAPPSTGQVTPSTAAPTVTAGSSPRRSARTALGRSSSFRKLSPFRRRAE